MCVNCQDDGSLLQACRRLPSNLKQKLGFSTLEIMLALAIMVLTLTAVIGLIFGSQSLVVSSQTSNEGLKKAQTMLEDARASFSQDFYSIRSIATATEDIYQKNLDIQDIDDYTKQATGRVTWQTGRVSRSVALTALLTGFQDAIGGSTCSQTLFGDWQHPQISSFNFALAINDAAGNYPISDINAYQGKLYVSVNNTSSNSNKTFFIFDIANPLNPVLLSQIDNAPVSAGPNAVAVAGHYAYVANGHSASFTTCSQNSNCAQLQIIDLSQNPPAVVKNFKVPGVTGSGGQAIGQSIVYNRGYIYLGLAKTGSGPEFNIIDVSDPLSPQIKGSAAIGNGINAIAVKGHYVYIASPNNQELIILDISNPTSPIVAGGFDAPGGGGNAGNGESLYLKGNDLYFGRTQLSGNEFYILDNANPPTSLPPLGFKDVKSGSNNLSVNGIVVKNNLAFLLAESQLQILDVTNPANISQEALPTSLPNSSTGTALYCEGNFLYAASVDSSKKGYISVITPGP